jgi:peptide/nickel transport system ATP-binding protein
MTVLHHLRERLERPGPAGRAGAPGAPGRPGAASPAGTPVLRADHLRKQFPLHRGAPFGARRALHAVEDVSLDLVPGRVTALVGESGSGKTTVARLLAGLYPPTSGAIRYRGAPVVARGAGLRAYRRQVQLVFQDPFSSLNPIHTVRYHLARPLRVFGHARRPAEETEQVLALLERVSLTPAEQFMRKYPHELSGGQRQRVAIARALAARPSVLLADEPVSMLDVSIRLEVLNLLMRLKEEDRMAVLYITHDIASARYFADEILVMYAGQVVEAGPSEEVIGDPRHPYTQLLLAAAPDPDRAAAPRGPAVARGDPPDLVGPPAGCRFRGRCAHAMPVCGERFPPPATFTAAHRAHCYLYRPHEHELDADAPPATHSEMIHDGNA